MSNSTFNSELLSRRLMLNRLGGGMGMLGAASLLSSQSACADADAGGHAGRHFPAKAKRVIHLFMNGGPFQADLFDPKPALAKYAGQRPEAANLRTERPTGGLLPSPFQFSPQGESGVPVSELLPKSRASTSTTCACCGRCTPTIRIMARRCCR